MCVSGAPPHSDVTDPPDPSQPFSLPAPPLQKHSQQIVHLPKFAHCAIPSRITSFLRSFMGAATLGMLFALLYIVLKCVEGWVRSE